jgi:hypothetical protein
MKILNISDISSSNAMPIKSGTLQFLQDAHKETIAGLVTNILPNPITGTIYILSGCVNSGTGSVYNISAGVIYYNGEIFNFDGISFTLTGLEKAYARIQTTQYITNADPVQFTDGVNRNVHNIRKFVVENTITSSGLPEFKDFVTVPSSWLSGDVKEIVCNEAYRIKYFDSTGLGRLERTGWAIMNGQNGTPSDAGKVTIAYGGGYELQQTGGVEEVTLTQNQIPSHTHQFQSDNADLSDGLQFGSNAGFQTGVVQQTTGATGGGQAHTNMQPFVVRLRIVKLY